MRTSFVLVLALSGCALRTGLPFGPTAVVDPSKGSEAGEDDASTLPCVADAGGRDFTAAGALVTGGQRGCLEREREYYVIEAPAQAEAGALYVLRLTADDQICATIYDQDRQRQGAACSTDREPRTFWAALAPSTRLYVELERTLSRRSPYLLDVREQLLDDPDEPNNGASRAVALRLGVSHSALMQRVLNDPELDSYYAVEAPASGRLAVVVVPGSPDATAEVDVFDVDHREIEDLTAANAGAVVRGTLQVKPGRYFVRVRELQSTIEAAGATATEDERPTGHFSQPYTIRIDLGERVSHR